MRPTFCLIEYQIISFVPYYLTDFGSSGECDRRALKVLKFYPVDGHCEAKALSEFRVMEDRFDSLDDCCRVKFPHGVSDCCETGEDNCILSGNIKFIPVSIFHTRITRRLFGLFLYLTTKYCPSPLF